MEKQKTKLNDLHNNPNLKIKNCVKNHTNASSDEQNIQNCQGLITNVKKKPHFFNIIFRVYALQSQSIDPKVMQLNRRDRKVSFEKLFCVYVFYYATLQSNEN